MIKHLAAVAFAAVITAAPAAASHVFNTTIPFDSRGECEAARQSLSNDDDFLLDAFPQLFSSPGEVRSFLNRAFTCEQSGAGAPWYIVDHRSEVIESEWFQRRL